METSVDELSSHLSTLTTTPNELATLDDRYPFSTFILPSMSSCPMASDGYDHLLIYHHQTLILFHLPTFEILFSTAISPLIESPISDICFYSISNCFLLSSSNIIYSFSSNKQIEIVQQFSNSIWSITHSLKSIFICYLFGFSIEEWDLDLNSRVLLKTWPKENLIEALDMGINCIRVINEYMGMSIKENDFSWRIDLFETLSMHRLRRGLTIEQENGLNNWIGILFPIDHFRWLFADGDQGLILIDQTDSQQQKQRHIRKLACNICLIRDGNSTRYASIIVQTYETLHLYPAEGLGISF